MLENPFKPITKEEDTDPAQNAKLVAVILGPDAAKKYAELDQGREGKKGDDQSDLKLTDAEKVVVKEARENEVWDRAHYIRWAESLGKDEKWVDNTFTINSDGSVTCRNLDLLSVTKLQEFPINLAVEGFLDLSSLTTADGLTLPESIGGTLNLERLTTAQGVTLPKSIGGYLDLGSLTTAQGLTFPKYIGGSLSLHHLTTAQGLSLPESVGRNIYFRNLPDTDLNDLRQRYPQYASNIQKIT